MKTKKIVFRGEIQSDIFGTCLVTPTTPTGLTFSGMLYGKFQAGDKVIVTIERREDEDTES